MRFAWGEGLRSPAPPSLPVTCVGRRTRWPARGERKEGELSRSLACALPLQAGDEAGRASWGQRVAGGSSQLQQSGRAPRPQPHREPQQRTRAGQRPPLGRQQETSRQNPQTWWGGARTRRRAYGCCQGIRGVQLEVRAEPAGRPQSQPTLAVAVEASRRSLAPEQWAECEARAARSPALLQEALARLSKFQTAEKRWSGSQAEFMALAEEHLLPHWRCGAAWHHSAAWQQALGTRQGRGNAKEALRIVESGVKLQLVTDAYSPAQTGRPDFSRKEKAVKGLLGGDGPEVDGLLHARGVPRVWLGNLQSALSPENLPFVEEKVEEAFNNGTAVHWQPEWGEPHTISPLGCAVKDEKRRLTIAPLLVNFFERYQKFKQERLQVGPVGRRPTGARVRGVLNQAGGEGSDAPPCCLPCGQDVEDYMQPGDWLWKWDAKAGYHMLFIHPSCWKYLCFSWKGKVIRGGEGARPWPRRGGGGGGGGDGGSPQGNGGTGRSKFDGLME